jgi:hypothetical protein
MGVLTLTGTSATATAASQAKYESRTGLALIVKLRVDELRAMANFTSVGVFAMPAKDAMRFTVFRADTGVFGFQHFETPQGNAFSGDLLLSALPANGNDVVLYLERLGTTLRYAVGTPDGAEIVSTTATTGGLTTVTGSGTGAIAIPTSSPAPGLRLDTLGVLSAARTGHARFARPLTSDGDAIGLYYFDENTGTTTADSIVGGTPLTLAGGAALSAGGTWGSGAGGGIAASVLRRRRRMASSSSFF